MILNFKFEIYPTSSQKDTLNQWFGCNRFVWNYFLNKEIETYNTTKKFNFYFQNCLDLTMLKKELVWLKDVPSTTLQNTLNNLNQALTQSFRTTKGFPNFKNKKRECKSVNIQMISAKNILSDQQIKLPKIGILKCKIHRKFPKNFTSCYVKCENFKYFVIFVCKKDEITNTKLVINKSVGIDLNSKTMTTYAWKILQLKIF